jgi:hypothetical protein
LIRAMAAAVSGCIDRKRAIASGSGDVVPGAGLDASVRS